MSFFPSLLLLGIVAVLAWRLAVSRTPAEDAARRAAASRALIVATIAQSIHFLEETVTGFHEAFPAVFGLPSIPLTVFVLFNVAFIVFWIVSVRGIVTARRWAYFAAWFLAIAGSANGIAHPLLAVVEAGYFPGLFSSIVVGAACVWLGRRLLRATELH